METEPMSKKTIPTWAESYLSVEGAECVEESIEEAERLTSGEIVPMMVFRSSTVGHIPLTLIFIFGFVVSVIYSFGLFEWSLWMGLGVVVLSLFLIRFLSSSSWVCRMLTPKKDQDAQVFQRACLELESSRVRHTKNKTGVLIFISLMERQVVVLADKAIDDHFDSFQWKDVVEVVVKGIKAKQLSEGLSEGILQCGKLLQEDFPIQKDDENELVNHFIIKE